MGVGHAASASPESSPDSWRDSMPAFKHRIGFTSDVLYQFNNESDGVQSLGLFASPLPNHLNTAGMTSRVSNVDVTSPPITTVARGR